MPKIVFQHKQQTPPPTPVVAPTKSTKPKRVNAQPPVAAPSPTPTQVVRSKPVVQTPPPVIEEKTIPVPEATKSEPVIQTPAEEPKTIVEIPVKEYNTPDKKQRIYQTETVVSTSDDDWGIMQVTKKKSAKEISESVQHTVQSTTGNAAVVLDGSGVALLIETIVTELGKQFVRKEEVYDLITKALQRMVMEDVKPK